MPALNDRLGPDKAEQSAAVAMRLMQQQGIAPTPPNYTVWYHFVSEDHPDLKRDMQDALKGNGIIEAQTVQTLYDRHFDIREERAKLEEAGNKFIGSISGLVGKLTEARSEYESIDSSMKDRLTRIGRSESRSDLQEQVIALVQDSAKVQALNSVLMDELEFVANEATSMKDTLVDAAQERRIDSLTGLANRDHFTDVLTSRMAEARANAQSLAIVMVDVDDFKIFNGKNGVDMGDNALKLIGSELARHCKDRDLAARYGGQEFAMIFEASNLQTALDRAESLRAAVAGRTIRSKKTGETLGQLTLSVGVATLMSRDDVSGFVERAHAELYTAKKTGKNKVCPTTRLAGAAVDQSTA